MALDVHLVTPEREVWAGPAQMVIAHGTDGMVGILTGHAPLLIRLSIARMRIQLEDGRWMVAAVDGGFLHVAHQDDVTRVDILAEHALLQDEVDREDPAAYEQRAEELRAEGRFDEARVELAKAAVRRRVAQNG